MPFVLSLQYRSHVISDSTRLWRSFDGTASMDHGMTSPRSANPPARQNFRRSTLMTLCLLWVFVVVGSFIWIRILNSQTVSRARAAQHE